MLKDYFIMKKSEWKIKRMLYSTVIGFIENQKEILDIAKRMYAALKDVPEEEIKKEFISKLAEIIHEEKPGKNG